MDWVKVLWNLDFIRYSLNRLAWIWRLKYLVQFLHHTRPDQRVVIEQLVNTLRREMQVRIAHTGGIITIIMVTLLQALVWLAAVVIFPCQCVFLTLSFISKASYQHIILQVLSNSGSRQCGQKCVEIFWSWNITLVYLQVLLGVFL